MHFTNTHTNSKFTTLLPKWVPPRKSLCSSLTPSPGKGCACAFKGAACGGLPPLRDGVKLVLSVHFHGKWILNRKYLMRQKNTSFLARELIPQDRCPDSVGWACEHLLLTYSRLGMSVHLFPANAIPGGLDRHLPEKWTQSTPPPNIHYLSLTLWVLNPIFKIFVLICNHFLLNPRKIDT